MSVTASQVASSSASVGTDAPQSKQEELTQKINDVIQNDDAFDGIDVGTDASNTPDEWGDAAGW